MITNTEALESNETPRLKGEHWKTLPDYSPQFGGRRLAITPLFLLYHHRVPRWRSILQRSSLLGVHGFRWSNRCVWTLARLIRRSGVNGSSIEITGSRETRFQIVIAILVGTGRVTISQFRSLSWKMGTRCLP